MVEFEGRAQGTNATFQAASAYFWSWGRSGIGTCSKRNQETTCNSSYDTGDLQELATLVVGK